RAPTHQQHRDRQDDDPDSLHLPYRDSRRYRLERDRATDHPLAQHVDVHLHVIEGVCVVTNTAMSATDEVIRARGVSVIYESRRGTTHALSDLDCSIRAREFVSIIGPSGCGK